MFKLIVIKIIPINNMFKIVIKFVLTVNIFNAHQRKIFFTKAGPITNNNQRSNTNIAGNTIALRHILSSSRANISSK